VIAAHVLLVFCAVGVGFFWGYRWASARHEAEMLRARLEDRRRFEAVRNILALARGVANDVEQEVRR
jgi:hypothetical protein